MLKGFCKIVFLSAFLSTILCAQSTYAQETNHTQKTKTTDVFGDVELMSAKDYANKNVKDLSSFFEDGAARVPCGDINTKCDIKTEKCLKCATSKTSSSSGFGGSTVTVYNTEFGICVPKESTIDDHKDKCKSSSSFNSSVYATLTEEPYGFLAESSTIYGVVELFKDKQTFKDSKGRTYTISFDQNRLTIAYAGKDFEGCEVLPVKIYNMQSCFFCPMAKILFRTINNVTEKSFSTFGKSFATVVVIVFAVWLAFVTLQQVFPLTKKDASDYIELLLKQSLKVLIAYYLLLNSATLFQLFISPVLSGGLEMGKKIQVAQLPDPTKKVDVGDHTISDGYYNIKTISGNTLHEQIESYLSSIQGQMAYLQAIGTSLFCVGSHVLVPDWKEVITGKAFENFGKGIRFMLLGVILMIIGFLLSITFAFYFLDAIIQLGFLGMMMPLMIAGWPFAITKHFASKGMGFLLNTFFVFFFTGFVISVNILLINESLTVAKAIKTGANSGGEGAFSAIIEALQNQKVQEVARATEIGGIGFLLLLFSSIFGFKFIGQVQPLASKLSDGGAIGGGIAGQMGARAASTVKGMAAKATKPAREAIDKRYKQSGGPVGMALGLAGGVANKAADVTDAVNKRMGNTKVGRAVSKTLGFVGNFGKKAQKSIAEASHDSESDK